MALYKKYHQIAPPARHQKQQQQQQQQCPNIYHLLHTNRAVTQGHHHLFYLKQFLLASDNTSTIFVSKSLPSSLWKRKEELA